MQRTVGWMMLVFFLAAGLLCGCRAPAPSLDASGLFGATRVPPPPTGAYKQAQNYYQKSPATERSGGARASLSQTTPPTAGSPGAAGTAAVQPASYNATISAVSGTSASKTQPAPGRANGTSSTVSAASKSSSSPGLRLNGMPVNDATTLVGRSEVLPPAQPAELSQLPPAAGNRPSGLLNILNPKPASPAAAPTPARPPSAPATAASWKSR